MISLIIINFNIQIMASKIFAKPIRANYSYKHLIIIVKITKIVPMVINQATISLEYP